VTTIRSGMPPVQPASTTGADAARLAAQRAYFQQAMGRPAAAAAPAPTAVQTPSPPVRTVELRPAANAEPPTKVLRPGSLLDIRV
jgi:hypothetical protein